MTTVGAADIPALTLGGVSKRFGDVAALSGVSMTVRRGTVHALLGENGAGKSTLMRVAAGLVRPDEGSVLVGGSPVATFSVRASARAGLGMVHQHLSLAESLTAPENVALGSTGLYQPRLVAEQLRSLIRASGLDVPLDVPVKAQSLAQRQRLEILKALSTEATVLILDEPTAVLAPSDVEDLLAWLRRFVEGGGSVVLVTHKLREALRIADDITVLRRGHVTFSGPARGNTEDSLARAVFPDMPPNIAPPALASGDDAVVASDLTLVDDDGVARIRHASFALRRHEIVGIAAVDGSGHRELLESLGGLRQASSGSLHLPPRVVVVPSDRHRDGIILSMTLTENVALRDAGQARGRINWARMRERTRALIRRFGIAAPSELAAAATLSGGNQQRLVVATALETAVDLVVADNPARGLDLGATAFVHAQLRAAAEAGAVVIVHASDVDELLPLVTRVLVVFHGEVRDAGLDRDRIGSMMLGAA